MGIGLSGLELKWVSHCRIMVFPVGLRRKHWWLGFWASDLGSKVRARWGGCSVWVEGFEFPAPSTTKAGVDRARVRGSHTACSFASSRTHTS